MMVPMKCANTLKVFLSIALLTFSFSGWAQNAQLALCPDETAAGRTLASPLVNDERVYLVISSTLLPACESITLPVPAEAAKWGRIISSNLLTGSGNSIILQGSFEAQQASISEIIVPQPEPPNRQTIAGKPAPRQSAAEAVSYRSTWLWEPAIWQQSPEAIWSTVTAFQLDRVYLTIPTTGNRVMDTDALAAFLSDAHDRNLAVWAVVGDRRDVLPESLPALLNRATAYRAFNDNQPAANQLDGLQLDIEPYLLQGFNLDQDYWRNRYIATIQAVHDTLSKALPMDLVMPVWWGNHPNWGEQLLQGIALPQTSITVMNYRADVDRLRAEAEPFLSWGENAGIPVHMALEYGVLQDEMRQHFYPDSAGELWLIDIGIHKVLLLLDAVYSDLPGSARKMAFTSEFDASALTFNGDPERLQAAIATLALDWSSWTSFAGIAIHGMEALAAMETPP